MAKKVRLCRAVESNVGERRAYKKQLLKIQDDFSKFVLNEIFVNLQQQNILALDSVFTPVESTKQLLQRLKKAKINPCSLFRCKKDCFVVYPGRIELPIES